MTNEREPNRLVHEKSPYLLQHAYNPVDWFPWGDEAFEKAKQEDKPVFLSVGYSTCHWCHVMAHESFEDPDAAALLNRYFVPVKVDREERPDIDGVYMRACQAMTGGGGWPLSVFLTTDGKPFFAGTYYPRETFMNLIGTIGQAWGRDREALLHNGEQIAQAIGRMEKRRGAAAGAPVEEAVASFRANFDRDYGGFGGAPKFPSPHNLMFLLRTAPELAEKTLLQMFRGGIFDHIGGGFSRYSTDRYWLVPHFEKMLYDNALLAMAYLTAYEETGKELYRTVAQKVFSYMERELAHPGGGFYSAQDADSEGVEGKYYLLTKDELLALLGREDGERFCRHFGITERGNYEGKSIPNLLGSEEPDDAAEALVPKVYEYRRARVALRTDKKLLTAWNALAAAAYATGARVLKDAGILDKARETLAFLERELTDGDTVFAGVTEGERSGPGFLDDYAFLIFALLQMHQASLEDAFLTRAASLAAKAVSAFWDGEHGGFFFSGAHNEKLIARPKESYDGAMPSGNSVMAYNLSRLAPLTGEERFYRWASEQRAFMNGEAAAYPSGFGFYLYAALPTRDIVCALRDREDLKSFAIRSDWIFRLENSPIYPMVNDRTTFYVCEDGTCRPPTNEPPGAAGAPG
jgi:uncharacterized protein YyaL (SSP411 family)